MNEPTNPWLRLLPGGLFLLLLAGAAVAAFTVVHLREQEGQFAAATVRLRVDINETTRRLQEMTSHVAAAEGPVYLREHTRLGPMVEKQIVWVRPGTTTVPLEAARPNVSAISFRVASAEPANPTTLIR